MNTISKIIAMLQKSDTSRPALEIVDRTTVALGTGIVFADRTFKPKARQLRLPESAPIGGDFCIGLAPGGKLEMREGKLAALAATGFLVLGGFHYAPGGNAGARKGGDGKPAINPRSLWDLRFRPASPDPAGMALIGGSLAPWFWCDIYLLGADHLVRGTSAYGVAIADGSTLPQKPPVTGRRSKALRADEAPRTEKLDYETGKAIMAFHGKGLIGLEEFPAAAYGVKERTAAGTDPKLTGLDPARTSAAGIMQATGNMWVWGHDGDPDDPRASLFGGSWLLDGDAGSRYASVDYWPGLSHDRVGARGRSDHLQLG